MALAAPGFLRRRRQIPLNTFRDPSSGSEPIHQPAVAVSVFYLQMMGTFDSGQPL
jgi:hypothetical protein